MTYSLINKCAKNYYNRTFIVQVIAKNVVTCFFLRHSVDVTCLDCLGLAAAPLAARPRLQRISQSLSVDSTESDIYSHAGHVSS